PNIDSDGLTQFRLGAVDVKQVVDDLKRETDLETTVRGRLYDGRRCLGESRGRPRPLLEQCRRLARYDFDVVGEGHRRIAPETPLQDLPFGEADAGLHRPVDERFIETGAELIGTAKEEVAGDQGLGEAILMKRRIPPTTAGAAVDDVVMQQTCRMD